MVAGHIFDNELNLAFRRKTRLRLDDRGLRFPLTVERQVVKNLATLLVEHAVMHVGEGAQAVQRAAPPGPHFDRLGREVLIEDGMAEISARKLIHREFIEENRLRGGEVLVVAGRPIQGQIQPQPVAFRAALGAPFLWRPRLRNTAGDENVARIPDVVPRGYSPIEISVGPGSPGRGRAFRARCTGSRARGLRACAPCGRRCPSTGPDTLRPWSPRTARRDPRFVGSSRCTRWRSARRRNHRPSSAS